MIVAPKPYKVACKKHFYFKYVYPKGGCDPLDILHQVKCPICGKVCERVPLNAFDKIAINILKP
ncbi:MAG: hypothetical protein K5978_08455 [Campylobacter sp.]|nr:hypothetical protein [Campylobacter sp.]